MGESKHTPGPWRFETAPGATNISEIRSEDGMPIAGVWRHFPGNASDHNGRLIAAAPELLDALREAIAFHEDEDNDDLARWRATIAKAEGRP